jgi:hypothetical protein
MERQTSDVTTSAACDMQGIGRHYSMYQWYYTSWDECRPCSCAGGLWVAVWGQRGALQGLPAAALPVTIMHSVESDASRTFDEQATGSVAV